MQSSVFGISRFETRTRAPAASASQRVVTMSLNLDVPVPSGRHVERFEPQWPQPRRNVSGGFATTGNVERPRQRPLDRHYSRWNEGLGTGLIPHGSYVATTSPGPPRRPCRGPGAQ